MASRIRDFSGVGPFFLTFLSSMTPYSATFRSVRAIAHRLFMSESFVLDALEQLKKLELASKKQDGTWEAGKKNIHLSKESVLNIINNKNWRDRAHSSSLIRQNDGIHYTGVYSLSRADFQRLREMTFEFLDQTRKVVVPSSEEEVVCCTCDLFVV